LNEACTEEEDSTQSDIEIVPAISKDIEGIATVLRESFPGKAKYYKIRSWEHESKKILRSDKGWITFIAVHQGRIVGVLAARHLKTVTPTVRIEWIAVAKILQAEGHWKGSLRPPHEMDNHGVLRSTGENNSQGKDRRPELLQEARATLLWQGLDEKKNWGAERRIGPVGCRPQWEVKL
jgi:hypothetical protein